MFVTLPYTAADSRAIMKKAHALARRIKADILAKSAFTLNVSYAKCFKRALKLAHASFKVATGVTKTFVTWRADVLDANMHGADKAVTLGREFNFTRQFGTVSVCVEGNGNGATRIRALAKDGNKLVSCVIHLGAVLFADQIKRASLDFSLPTVFDCVCHDAYSI